METLVKIWVDLATTVISPTKEWLLKRSYWQRVAILLLIPFATVAYTQRAATGAYAHALLGIGRVFTAGTRIPLSDPTEERVETLAKRIEIQAEADLRTQIMAATTDDGGWAVAQLVVALSARGALPIEPEKIASFLRNQRSSRNVYWAQVNEHPHLARTAWCIRALACLKSPATDAELAYLLDQQGPDGGWPLFVGTSAVEESTFATALVMMALNEQLAMPRFSQKTLDRMRGAMERGEGWLIQNGDRDRARWKFYPLQSDSSETESDSGLVLYALESIARTDRRDVTYSDLSQAWLRSLPVALPRRVTDVEMSGEWFGTGTTLTFDSVRHLRLPWLLLGTVSSYQHGSLAERVRALSVIEDAVDNQDWGVGGTRIYQHAEMLLAITELQRQAGKRPGQRAGF